MATGNPYRSPEELFQAYLQAVRHLDPEEVRSLCDPETLELGDFFVTDQDPDDHPLYSTIPNLPGTIREYRGMNRYLLDRIPAEITDPRERFLKLLRLRMESAGDDYCRKIQGRIDKISQDMTVPHVSHPVVEMDVTFKDGQGGGQRSIKMARSPEGFQICYFSVLVLRASLHEPLEVMDDDDDGRDKANNGVGNGEDGQPPGNPPVNDGPGTGPGNPGNKGGPER